MDDREQNQVAVSSQSVEYRGPLPTSSEFEGYERALSGAADRILTICEKEVEHRHENESKIINQSMRLADRGQIFAFILSILSIGAIVASIFFSRPLLSIAPTLIVVASLASIVSNSSGKKNKG